MRAFCVRKLYGARRLHDEIPPQPPPPVAYIKIRPACSPADAANVHRRGGGGEDDGPATVGRRRDNSRKLTRWSPFPTPPPARVGPYERGRRAAGLRGWLESNDDDDDDNETVPLTTTYGVVFVRYSPTRTRTRIRTGYDGVYR